MGGIDADAELVSLVRRLIAVSVADPANALVARELRNALLALPGERQPDPVAALQARVAAGSARAAAGLPPSPDEQWRSPWRAAEEET
jgi:hypothetical protein